MPPLSFEKNQSELQFAIYSAARDLDLWPGVLEKIAAYFDDHGSNLFWLTSSGSIRIIHSPSMELGALEYAEKWAHRDVRAQRAIAESFHTSRLAISTSSIMTAEEMDREPFFTEFLYKYDLKDVAATFLSPRPDHFIGLSVHRRRSKPDFNAIELNALADIGRHVENALHLAIEMYDARLQGLGEGFDGIDVAVIGIDESGHPVFKNRAARLLVETLEDDGIARLISTLRGARSEDVFSDALGVGAGGRHGFWSGGRARVYVDDAIGQRFLVRTMPVPRPREASMFGHANHLIMITPMLGSRAVDQSLVRDVFSLSAAEARVATALAMGLSLDEAAAQCGITKETARTVLKRIFAKTKTSRQHELVTLIRDVRI